ncbi:MAG: hypothetical protein JWQ06_1246 [Mucilaginibacter sp.]|nr:hypothetical protein [Mucilaginibacter sp.]
MNMKFNYIILLAIILAVVSCKKDNYKAPGTTLSGRLMYKGDSVGVEYNQVPFNIYQPGFGKTGAITGTFAPDGSYSILTFDGNYRFTIPPAQGPFLWKELTASARDTVKITLNGSQTYNIEVTPYYMIRNLKTSVTPGVVTANFSIEQVITDPALAKSIQTVSLYINKTVFVSEGNNENIAKFDLAGTAITSLSNVTLNVTVPTLSPTQNYVYARVGIKITGVEDLMFSPLRRITLK